MANPLVSIVIPCYNGAAFVAEAIESALNQTYPHKEVIVVDDGSTDDSLRVIRSFGSSVISLTGENAGVAAARNKGAAAARGELLQFLDQDDLLYAHKLERQVPLALAHRPGMVFCDMDVVDLETGRKLRQWGTGHISTADPVVHALSTVIQTSGPLHWRETFAAAGGFREHLSLSDDQDLILRMACRGVAFHHLRESLHVWRCHAESESGKSRRNARAGLETHRQIGSDAYNELIHDGRMTGPRREAFACYHFKIGRRAMRFGLPDLAQACFSQARSVDPSQGFRGAYSPGTRAIARLLGPYTTERLVMWKRRLFGAFDHR